MFMCYSLLAVTLEGKVAFNFGKESVSGENFDVLRKVLQHYFRGGINFNCDLFI